MGFKPIDLTMVVPDVLQARRVILRGFECLQRMRPHAEVEIKQSERILRRLMRSTLRQGQVRQVRTLVA